MSARDRRRIAVLATIGVAISVAALLPTAGERGLQAQLTERIYLPLTLVDAEPPPPIGGQDPTATRAVPTEAPPTATDAPTEPPTPTEEPATATPTEAPATPTTKPSTGTIRGQYVSRGEPIAAGFGAPGVPQIELQRQDGGQWTKVANAETADEGRFEFVDPPALEGGQVYQVWWVNTSLIGYDEWVGRWNSQRIAAFGDGTDVDLGTMEIGNVALTGPGNDVHFSLPVTYEWDRRVDRDESYRWSLHTDSSCDENRREPPSLYRTSSLGYRGSYTLSSPPPGFRMETLYCWYVYVDAGTKGTGWSFEGWRTKWLIAALRLGR